MNRNWTAPFSLGALGLLVTLSITILSSSEAIAAADCTRNPDAPICGGDGPKPKPKPQTQTPQSPPPVMLIEGMITTTGCDKVYFRLERDTTIPADQTHYVLGQGKNTGWKSITLYNQRTRQNIELQIEGYGSVASGAFFTNELSYGVGLNKVGFLGFHYYNIFDQLPIIDRPLKAGSRMVVDWRYEAPVPSICNYGVEYYPGSLPPIPSR